MSGEMAIVPVGLESHEKWGSLTGLAVEGNHRLAMLQFNNVAEAVIAGK